MQANISWCNFTQLNAKTYLQKIKHRATLFFDMHDKVHSIQSKVVPFKTKSFPEQGVWRVHAFGEVRRNSFISNEPTVDVFIVPLIDANCPEDQLNFSKSYDYARLQSVRIGIGQISAICVGSLLKNQKRMYKLPDYTLRKFVFNAENDFCKIIRAGISYEKNGKFHRIIPDGYYRVPNELRNMPCLVFNAADNRAKSKNKEKIIIPCWTVFQYYYATSSKLSTALINGELEVGSNQIYNPDPTLTHHNPQDGYFHLRLRPRMFDKDAQTIARIASDERVTQIAKNICNSMIAGLNNGKGAFPEVRLPFFGDTEIEVSGKNIKCAGSWYFFVYNIRSCKGEFYYDKLKYDRNDHNQQNAIDDPNIESACNTPERHISKPRPKEDGQKITDDEPPSHIITGTEVILPPRNFLSQPTTLLKLPEKIRKYPSSKAESIIRTRGTEKHFSTGEGGSNGESARLDIKTDPENETKERKLRESAPPDFDSMIQVLELIQEKKSPDFAYELIPVIEDDEYELTGFSVFPAYRNGKRVAWSFIPGNPPRRRQVMVAEIIYKNARFYLFEIERRVNALGKPTEKFHTVIIHRNLDVIEKIELKQVLSFMTKKGGVCSGEWEFETLIREKLKHGWLVESFAKTLTDYFEDEISNNINSKISSDDDQSNFRLTQTQLIRENSDTDLRRIA